MRWEFEVRPLIQLPIQDWSELELLLEDRHLDGWEMQSVFESFASFRDESDRKREALYLFGIFRKPKASTSPDLPGLVTGE